MKTMSDDYLDLDGLFSADELALRDRVRAFVDERIRPNIAALVRDRELPPRAGQGDGRARPARHAPDGLRLRRAARAVEYGLAAMELEAGDSGHPHVRLGAGVAGDERDRTSSARRSRSSGGCPAWPRAS